MLLGVIADTHDRIPLIEDFAKRFREAGVEMVLHAGDYCSPWALRPLLEASLPLVGVFGRNDGDHEGLIAEAQKGVGAELYASPHSVDVAGTRILLIHDIVDVNERSVAGHGIVVHGGSHRYSMEHTGETLVLNPGEACGWITGKASAALLDLNTNHVEFIFP